MLTSQEADVISTIAKRIGRPLALGMMLSVGLVCGCKTDEVANPERTRPEGPTTNMMSPAGVNVPDIPITNRTEVDLVEEMMMHRAMYSRLLQALVTFYSERGNDEKATWARTELNDLKNHVKPYKYIKDAELPAENLQPTNSVAEADKLYDEAMALLKKGGHGVPVFYNQETMKQALAKFKELVDKYPSSDKIDDACFYIGEIHKEYFEEKDNSIAIDWYKRALTYNPKTPHPVRFQIAVIVDFRLHEREEALKWYNAVLTEEPDAEKSNTEFSKKRIRQLTDEKTRNSPGDTVTEPGAPPAAPKK
jgi:TolA-binding protein